MVVINESIAVELSLISGRWIQVPVDKYVLFHRNNFNTAGSDLIALTAGLEMVIAISGSESYLLHKLTNGYVTPS